MISQSFMHKILEILTYIDLTSLKVDEKLLINNTDCVNCSGVIIRIQKSLGEHAKYKRSICVEKHT